MEICIRYSLWVAIIYCMFKFFLRGQILGWMVSQQKGGKMKQTNKNGQNGGKFLKVIDVYDIDLFNDFMAVYLWLKT